MKHIPIAAAKAFAKQHHLKQVVIMAWDGAQMHVATYGGSVVDSAQAAAGGNFLKKALGFPAEACPAIPAKVVRAGEKMRRQAAEKTEPKNTQWSPVQLCIPLGRRAKSP
jgi:hypothetical protein